MNVVNVVPESPKDGARVASVESVANCAEMHVDQRSTWGAATPYWAWSFEERRWVCLTFGQHQAWMARPDLDAWEFANGTSRG